WFSSRLNERTNKSIFSPGKERLATEVCRDGDRSTLHLAPLDSNVNIRRALIAGDNSKFRAQGFFDELGYLVEMRARPRGAALGWFRSFTYIVDTFVSAIPAHYKDVVVLLWATDPVEFPPVELNFLSTN